MTPWFKLWTRSLPIFQAAPDDALGRAIRAALVYCNSGEVPELDPMANLIFSVLRKDVDEAIVQFQEAVESGKRGATTRWKKTASDNRDPMESDGDPTPPYGDPIKKNAEGKEGKEGREGREGKEAKEGKEGKEARKGAKKAPGRKAAPDWQSMMAEYPFSPAVREAILEWLRYKSERREPYRTQGLRSLLRQLDASCQQYGDDAVVQLIGQCMASGWKGLIFDRLSTASPAKPTGPRQPDEQERQAIERMMGQME